MAVNLEEFPDRVAEMYKDKTVFITGGTGFMGKVLIEKMLRSCPEVKRIILMVRSKKGKHPKERVREIFANPLFDMVKEQRGKDIIEKVDAVVGDVMLPQLGISEEDREMLASEVHFIYHCAATIRFDEPLRRAVLLNARGTKFMLDLAKECKKLLCFIHVSTAYCHLSERILYEIPYPPPADPHKVIQAVEWLSDDIIDSITPKILQDIPNTYAFTKALGEALVVEQKELGNLPVIILRPSVVIPIYKEPIPGWTDNINGPTGLLIGAGKGVLRTMYCKQESYADYLPVDIAVNASMISLWYYSTQNKEKWIYNLTSSAEHKVTMEEIITIGRKVINERIPLNGVAWYPGGSMKRSRIVHLICFFFFHLVPAVLVDALLIILGYKPVLCRVQKRIWKGFEVFEYYANNQWDFDNVESLNARDTLNPRERQIYKCDGDDVDYYEYFTTCVHAARLYILKEGDETLPAARRHMFVMWIVDIVFKGLFLLGGLYYLYQKILSPIIASL
ncbi:unnamed protein product [Ceutorhynchus assimilis]|uniref:Fatty acyl-CoA reductase n=1 Tax=Ceutorhynchus assimilis TaxID=467358 RepID=A0A9N9MML7_9CUCU|nr:unnamed protein product [Ceutorhynchus assimilis]